MSTESVYYILTSKLTHLNDVFPWAVRVHVLLQQERSCFCLFVCLGIIVPLENLSLIWRRHHCRWRAAKFDLCSALISIEQWRFYTLSHLLRHGASVNNNHLWGHMTLTFGIGAVTTCFYDLVRSGWEMICFIFILIFNRIIDITGFPWLEKLT